MSRQHALDKLWGAVAAASGLLCKQRTSIPLERSWHVQLRNQPSGMVQADLLVCAGVRPADE